MTPTKYNTFYGHANPVRPSSLERSYSSPAILQKAREIQHPNRVRSLSETSLTGRGGSIRHIQASQRGKVRAAVQRFWGRNKSQKKDDLQPLWKRYYTSELIRLVNQHPSESKEKIAGFFIKSTPKSKRSLLAKIGLGRKEKVVKFLNFLDLRAEVEKQTIAFPKGFDQPYPIAEKTVETIISSFRCANNPSFTNTEFLTLNGEAVPLPLNWEGTEKGFFTWLFHHCNILFGVSDSAEEQATQFCNGQTGSIPYLLPIQCLTINAFPTAAAFIKGLGQGKMILKPPHGQKMRYQIHYNSFTKTFKATQVKNYLLYHHEKGGIAEFEAHWTIHGKLGEADVSASLRFNNFQFSMKRDIVYWYEALAVMAGLNSKKPHPSQ